MLTTDVHTNIIIVHSQRVIATEMLLLIYFIHIFRVNILFVCVQIKYFNKQKWKRNKNQLASN